MAREADRLQSDPTFSTQPPSMNLMALSILESFHFDPLPTDSSGHLHRNFSSQNVCHQLPGTLFSQAIYALLGFHRSVSKIVSTPS
uniref:Uncharacterized protein n=1 Tax=Daphnia magna TaxID=35525 RepID=A0A0N8E0C0_9CRUS